MQPGIVTLLRRHPSWLAGRRVGLASHQAAVSPDGATSAELLHAALGDRLVALLGPEHGYFGLAGAGVPTSGAPHPEWGIPIYSLYGEHRRPTPAMLAGIDVLVVDFQDLGVRCYTYLSTLRRLLEAATEAGIGVIVADRPIPLPRIVDGPPLEPAWRSFVADAPLPLVYGMTPGESARWLVTTLGLRTDLRVAPCTGWRHRTGQLHGAPEWIPPSPAIRSPECARAYAATVFTEALPDIDCGRSGALAFRILGAPWIDAARLCRSLAREALPGAAFHPHRYRAGPGAWEGTELTGVRITVTDPDRFQPATASVVLLDHLGRQRGRDTFWHNPGVRPDFFDRLYGSPQTRLALEAGRTGSEVAASWRTSLDAFESTRQPALLYPEPRTHDVVSDQTTTDIQPR